MVALAAPARLTAATLALTLFFGARAAAQSAPSSAPASPPVSRPTSRAPAPPQHPPAVAIDTRGVDAGDALSLGLLDLQSRLALRLTQAGFAVVAREHHPLIAIFLRVDAPKGRRHGGTELILDIRVASASHWRQRRLRRGRRARASFHLEALHKAIEATREVEAAIRASQARRPRAPAPAPEHPPGLAPKPPTTRPQKAKPGTPPWPESRVEMSALVLAEVRKGGTDILFRVGGRVRLWDSPFGARWSLRYSPSSASSGDSEVRISEWGLELGLDWRRPLSSDGKLRLDLGVMAGFGAHRFGFGPQDAEEVQSGTRWDVSVSAFSQLSLRITKSFGLALWLCGGFGEDDREHRLEGSDEPLWRRERLRLEAGGGLRVDLK